MPLSNNDVRPPASTLPGSRRKLGVAAAGLLLLGAAAGALAEAESRPSVSMAPVKPVAIGSISRGIVTIRGRVAEIFGNKVIVADGSGRALVDLGRDGDERQIVTAGEPVTVQGRFDRGFVHAAFLVGPDDKVLALGPLAAPPRDRPGADGGPDGPPSPPRPDRSHDALPPALPASPVAE